MNRRPAWTAVALALGAGVIVLIGSIGAVGAFDLQTIEVDGSASFIVEDPGPWLVAVESRAVLGGREVVGGSVDMKDVECLGPDGTDRQLEAVDHDIRYEQPGRAGEVLGRFMAGESGTWTIVVHGVDGPVLLAIGPDRLEAMVMWTMVSGGLAVVFLGAALGFGWVAWRTRG